MGRATANITKLKSGETVSCCPRGNSIKGEIESGQPCMVEPISNFESLQKGDIVLCKVNGNECLSSIKAIQVIRFQIGNNPRRVNGWISINAIFGKCVKIEN
jgi:hypothetical protein